MRRCRQTRCVGAEVPECTQPLFPFRLVLGTTSIVVDYSKTDNRCYSVILVTTWTSLDILATATTTEQDAISPCMIKELPWQPSVS